ncbi:MAG: hypothetical protein RIQ53_724 [Pseudomonadota bacterium]|jgi:hypothetical protein
MTKTNAILRPPTQADEAIGDVTLVRGRLALLGWKSLRAWSVAHGYLPCTVRATIVTWGDRADRRKPHGGIARTVMRDLRATLENKITPEERSLRHSSSVAADSCIGQQA